MPVCPLQLALSAAAAVESRSVGRCEKHRVNVDAVPPGPCAGGHALRRGGRDFCGPPAAGQGAVRQLPLLLLLRLLGAAARAVTLPVPGLVIV